MANPFYGVTGNPPNQTRGISSSIRAEYSLIQDGFDIVSNYCVDSGTSNAISISPVASLVTLTDGLRFSIKTANATSGPTTVSIGGFGTLPLQRQDGTPVTTDLMAGDVFQCVYSATAGALRLLGVTKNYIDQMVISPVLPGQPAGTVAYFLSSKNGSANWQLPSLQKSSRTSNAALAAIDSGTFIDITSGTFTQTFAAAATLGNGWYCWLKNSGTGDITLDPNASETIDGLTSYIMYPGEARLVQCDGVGFNTIVIHPFSYKFTSSGTFTTPPGYAYFGGIAWSAGASGQAVATTSSAARGGSGGGAFPFVIPAATMGASQTVTIGAGGASVSGSAAGIAGGDTSIGSILTIKGASASGKGGAISGLDGKAVTDCYGFESSSAAIVPRNAVWGGATSSTDGSSPLGGNSMYGGASGGSLGASGGAGSSYAGGASVFGGNGGASAVPNANAVDGSVPSGGGGAVQGTGLSGAGARGEVRIWGGLA